MFNDLTGTADISIDASGNGEIVYEKLLRQELAAECLRRDMEIVSAVDAQDKALQELFREISAVKRMSWVNSDMIYHG